MKIDVKSAIEESADNLIGLGFLDDYTDNQLIVERAIYHWLENLIDDLAQNIDWYYRNDSKLEKLILREIDKSESIHEDDEISLTDLYPNGIDLSEIFDDKLAS